MIRTPEQYLKSLNDGRVLYFNGEQVPDPAKHPLLKRQCTVNVLGYTFVNHPKYRDQVTVVEDGERSMFLWNQPKTVEDMMKRRQIYLTMRRIGASVSAVGVDALAAAGIVATKMDRMLGTHYMDAVEDYRAHIKKTDPILSGAITDVKGNRSLRPGAQEQHQDFYVRVVDRQKEGIVVRGAKIFISGTGASNETIVQPCRAHREEDKDCAVVFATPLNAEGITIIVSPPDFQELEDEEAFWNWPDSAVKGGHTECMIIFDDVFVPWNRVFMCGEWQFGSDIARTFGKFHRLFGSVRSSVDLEVLVGTAALLAEYNGLDRYPHIQEKLAWLTYHAETVDALSKAACMNPDFDEETGLPIPSQMYINIAKYKFANDAAEASKMAADICGGIISCVPNYKDWNNPQMRAIFDKYLAAKAGVPTEHRLRAVRLLKNLTAFNRDQTQIHAEGSLMAQKIMLYAGGDWERYKAAAKRVAGIQGWETHEVFKDLVEFEPDKVLKGLRA
jgi:4-hydroxybutyryl-CoA dehydratase/vinylacetyl-CoA-Delta-isomerase